LTLSAIQHINVSLSVMAAASYSLSRALTLNPEPKPAFYFSAPTVTPNLFFSVTRKFPLRAQSRLGLSPDLAGALHLDQPMQSFNSLEPVAEAVVGPSVAFGPRSKRPPKNVLLFHCEETSDLARRVVAESDAIELRSISWK
jgi:hypothetical protein